MNSLPGLSAPLQPLQRWVRCWCRVRMSRVSFLRSDFVSVSRAHVQKKKKTTLLILLFLKKKKIITLRRHNITRGIIVIVCYFKRSDLRIFYEEFCSRNQTCRQWMFPWVRRWLELVAMGFCWGTAEIPGKRKHARTTSTAT